MEELVVGAVTLVSAGGFYAHKQRFLCLNCSRPLTKMFKKPEGGTITCSRCQVSYARTALDDADKDTWDKVRKERLFSLHRANGNQQILYLHHPLR